MVSTESAAPKADLTVLGLHRLGLAWVPGRVLRPNQAHLECFLGAPCSHVLALVCGGPALSLGHSERSRVSALREQFQDAFVQVFHSRIQIQART